MKKNLTTRPSKRLVLDREILADLGTGGGGAKATLLCFRTYNGCLTITCGLRSCADCAAE